MLIYRSHNLKDHHRIKQTIVQCLLIGPVGPVFDSTLFEVWMVLGQTRVKDGDAYPRSWGITITDFFVATNN